MSEKIIYAILGPGVSGVGAGNLLASRGESFAVIGNQDPKNWMHKFELPKGKWFFSGKRQRLIRFLITLSTYSSLDPS